jgi:hypothetical protein
MLWRDGFTCARAQGVNRLTHFQVGSCRSCLDSPEIWRMKPNANLSSLSPSTLSKELDLHPKLVFMAEI